MLVPRRVFRDFFSERLGKTLVVASLPEELRPHLMARTHEIKMDLDYARKILVEKKLTYEHLYIVQRAMDEGFCKEGKTPDHLEFLYISDDQKVWILVIKAAAQGAELWFCTLFYTSNEKYYRKKFHGADLIRRQDPVSLRDIP